MGDGHTATGTRSQRLILVGLLVGLLVTSAAPGHAQRGGHGGHGGHSGPHGGAMADTAAMASLGHASWCLSGRTGTPTGICMSPPRELLLHPPRCMSNLPHPPGTTVRIPQGTTRMCNSAPAAGNRSLHHPNTLSLLNLTAAPVPRAGPRPRAYTAHPGCRPEP